MNVATRRRHARARARARRRFARRPAAARSSSASKASSARARRRSSAACCAGLGVAGAIRSPTYTLIEPYEQAGLQLYHIDLYRLSGAREVEALGIRDLLDERAVLLIEWPSRGAGALPTEDLSISIEYPTAGRRGAQLRLLRAQAHSSAGDKLLEHILAATSE